MPANLNLNLPQVPMRPISPVLGPQPLEGLISGIERGRSLGLREKQMAMAEEEAKRQQKQIDLQTVKVFGDQLETYKKSPKTYEQFFKNYYAPAVEKALGPDFAVATDSFSFGNENDLKAGEEYKTIVANVVNGVTPPGMAANLLNKVLADYNTSEDLEKKVKSSIDLYSKQGDGKNFYFVDPSTKEMFDSNLQPILEAPSNASPRMLTNPNQSNEGIRRNALVKSASTSVSTAKSLLTPNVLNEIKGIKFTPGKIYQQLASPQAKKFYRNLRNAISSELYLKTGAAATPGEIEERALLYMPAANDDIADVQDRLDMLSGEASNFGGGVPSSNAKPKKDSLGLF